MFISTTERSRIAEAFAAIALATSLAACSGVKPGPAAPPKARGTQFNAVPYDSRPKEWKEDATTLPAYPQAANLQPFSIEGRSDNQFFVDASSISVDPDGVVRYTAVVRSPSGVENVSYEGIRCEKRQWKLYAIGQPGAEWAAARTTDWRQIERRNINAYQFALYDYYFCRDGYQVADAKEALGAMRRNYRAGPQGR